MEKNPGNWKTPGWPIRKKPVLGPDSRGCEKLFAQGNVRRATQTPHDAQYQADGERRRIGPTSSLRPVRPKPFGNRKGVHICPLLRLQGLGAPEIQKKIRKDAALGANERDETRALCAELLNAAVARRAIRSDK